MATGLGSLPEFCVPISIGPGQICVTFPGGVTLCAQQGIETGDANQITRSLMGQINSALMPLMPFFNTLDVIKAIIDCIQAIPDCILQLSPEPILSCIPDLVKKLKKLLELIPQLSVPVLIATIIDAVIVALIGLRAELASLIAQQARILAAETRAAQLGNVALRTITDCATENMQAQLANYNESMKPLQRLVGVLNTLLAIAGLPELDVFPALGEELSTDMFTVLDRIVDGLEIARKALPV